MIALVLVTLILLWFKKPKPPAQDFPTNTVIRVLIIILMMSCALVLVAQILFTKVFVTSNNGYEIFVFTWSIFNYSSVFPCFLVDSMLNLKQYFWDTLHKLKCKITFMFCSASVGVIDVIV
eukprot:04696.XXX_20363_20725_1 [CDS] Oithona nana genome sequencing.